ncbi:hypothetical protein [Streptococcus suis]|uniref:hypothetical protein n=1 Tax=Streptococcus suis TaxID=1307 RepID=UPI001EDF080F|nr:hypothetical protein [Streptococcus suis]
MFFYSSVQVNPRILNWGSLHIVYISGSVLAQTFLLAGLGTVLGLAGTYLSSLVLPSAVPFENNWTFYIAIGLALVVFALLGASFSVGSIFKVDPLRNLS